MATLSPNLNLRPRNATPLIVTASKIKTSNLMVITAGIFTAFTLINLRAMSYANCCEPGVVRAGIAGVDCSHLPERPPSIISLRNKLTNPPTFAFQNGTNRVDYESLESSLLFLFNSIDPPHWSDSDKGEQHLNMKSVTNVYHRSLYVDKEDITLVTHGSIEKFSQLVDQVSRWKGPVSFVIYLASVSDVQSFCSNMRSKVTPEVLKLVSIHALLEKHGGKLPYPNNVLRNIAQRNIESNYFLLMDVDFIPTPGMYEHLKANLANDYFWNRLRNNTVFVLPAFERFAPTEDSYATLEMVPKTKAELKVLLRKEEAVTFHHYFPPGHYPTNFSHWLQPNIKNDFSYPIEYSKRFEPYVIAYKRGIPEFWDGFRGFGFNAATWFWELHLAGFHFEVVHDHFITHLNHPGRRGRNITDGSIAKLQLRRFMRYISRKYQVDQMQLRYWKGRKYGNGTEVSLVCYTCK